GRDGAFSCVSSSSSWAVASSSTEVAARSNGPQWSQSAACMINCLALNSGHNPEATSCQSTTSACGQSVPGGVPFDATMFEDRLINCRYFDTFWLQSAHERT